MYSLLSTVFWAGPKEVVHWMHWYKWRRQLAVLLRRSFELQFVPLRIDPIVLPLKLTTKTTRCNDVQLDTFICWLSTRRCNYVVADMLPLMRCLLTCGCRSILLRLASTVLAADSACCRLGSKSSISDFTPKKNAIKLSNKTWLPLFIAVLHSRASRM